MDRGAWWAAVQGVAKSYTIEQPTQLTLLLLSHLIPRRWVISTHLMEEEVEAQRNNLCKVT